MVWSQGWWGINIPRVREAAVPKKPEILPRKRGEQQQLQQQQQQQQQEQQQEQQQIDRHTTILIEPEQPVKVATQESHNFVRWSRIQDGKKSCWQADNIDFPTIFGGSGEKCWGEVAACGSIGSPFKSATMTHKRGDVHQGLQNTPPLLRLLPDGKT